MANPGSPPGDLDRDPLEESLASRLYRFDCPSPDVIGEYHLNLLAVEDRTAVARHVLKCRHCAEELAVLRQFMASNDVLETAQAVYPVVRRRLIAQLLSPPTGGWKGQPAPAGVRGNAPSSATYQAEDVTVSITLGADSAQANRREFLALVLRPNKPGIEGSTVQLQQEGALVDQTAIDELGNFTFGGLAPGLYDLTLQLDDADVFLENVQV